MATATRSDAKAVKIALNLIKADRALQPRVEMDDEHMNRMARAYLDGEDIPPPVHVFWDGKFYWLVDGFHRYKAMWSIRHTAKKFTEIRCFVHHGTKREAIVYAAQANLDCRSKPMSDADRKKAMWMLMDDEEWRRKSSSMLGGMLGLSSTTAKRYWVEYFHVKNLEVPDFAETSSGRVRATSHRSPGSKTKPRLSVDVRGKIYTSINGKQYCLGKDADAAAGRADEIMDGLDRRRVDYEHTSAIIARFIRLNIHAKSIIGSNGSPAYRGIYGFDVGGVAATCEPFRTPRGCADSIGRAVCCRELIGATRTVVLCPVEDGPPEVMALGRKAGIEFMTIEDFIASLKPQE